MTELVQDVGQNEPALGQQGDDPCNFQTRKGRQGICGVCGREKDRVQVTGSELEQPF